MSCTGFLQPLDLECILVNTFAGSMDIFSFIAMISIAMAGAYFRMMNLTLVIMYAIFAIIMSQFLSGIYFLAVLIAGLSIAFILSRIVKS